VRGCAFRECVCACVCLRVCMCAWVWVCVCGCACACATPVSLHRAQSLPLFSYIFFAIFDSEGAKGTQFGVSIAATVVALFLLGVMSVRAAAVDSVPATAPPPPLWPFSGRCLVHACSFIPLACPGLLYCCPTVLCPAGGVHQAKQDHQRFADDPERQPDRRRRVPHWLRHRDRGGRGEHAVRVAGGRELAFRRDRVCCAGMQRYLFVGFDRTRFENRSVCCAGMQRYLFVGFVCR
jgi:hypothetical protein